MNVGRAARIWALPASILIVICSVGIRTNAQIIGNTGREKVAIRSTAPPPVRTQPTRPVRTAVISRKVYIRPTTGSLSVATAPKASIVLQRIDRDDEPEAASMPDDGSQAVFNDLQPGRYRVSAELDGYTSAEDTVTISRNEQEGILLNLRPLLFSVTVATNVSDGEIRYARVRSYQDPLTGEEKYNAIGGMCMMPIQQGKANLNDLQAGIYGIDVRPADVGYATKLLVFTLSGDPRGALRVEANVERNESTRSFSATWSAGEWDLPVGWRLGSPMQINSPGLAFPHEETVRHYRDFKLVTDVRSLNGVGISLVLRARDPQNYYLVRVTGPSDPEPLKLMGYVVKNGVRQAPFTIINLSHLRDVIRSGKFFNLEMSVRGNSISVVLNDSELGGQYPLGVLEDSFSNYPIGMVGIAGTAGERGEIGGFSISPLR